jgi:hypothetical protein
MSCHRADDAIKTLLKYFHTCYEKRITTSHSKKICRLFLYNMLCRMIIITKQLRPTTKARRHKGRTKRLVTVLLPIDLCGLWASCVRHPLDRGPGRPGSRRPSADGRAGGLPHGREGMRGLGDQRGREPGRAGGQGALAFGMGGLPAGQSQPSAGQAFLSNSNAIVPPWNAAM